VKKTFDETTTATKRRRRRNRQNFYAFASAAGEEDASEWNGREDERDDDGREITSKKKSGENKKGDDALTASESFFEQEVDLDVLARNRRELGRSALSNFGTTTKEEEEEEKKRNPAEKSSKKRNDESKTKGMTSMEMARKLKIRLEAEVLEENRRRQALESDDAKRHPQTGAMGTRKTAYQRRVQTHELVRANSSLMMAASSSSSSSSFSSQQQPRGVSTATQNRREYSQQVSRLPPLKGRQQKATTITGDFIRTAKPKTFETLKVVLDAVSDRYEVNVEKTVWTKTLWKYVSQEWDFNYEKNGVNDSEDEDDIIQIIDIVNGRDVHELIELWAKRRKVFRGVSSSNVKQVIGDATIDEEKLDEENMPPENEQIIALELERIKSRAIRVNPNAKGMLLLATARAYDDLGFTVRAKKAWTDVETYYDNCADGGDKKIVELKIERLCSCSRHVNRLDDAKTCFLDLALRIRPRSGFKRKAFTAACKVINQTKDVELAMTVYESMKRNRENGDAFIVATLISAFGVENGRPTIEEMKKIGLECWSRAKKKDIVLDGQCYSSIVGLLCKAKDAAKAMEIIRELETTEKWMARGTIGAKSFAAAFKYEQQKQRQQHSPQDDGDDNETSANEDDSTKNKNYYDFAAAKRLRQLKKQQFKELRDDREAKKNRENVEPAYAQVMHFLCDSKQPKQALLVFQNMQRNGVPPSKSTFRALYKALRYAGGRNGRISNKTAARFAIDAVTSNSQSKLTPPLFASYDESDGKGARRRYRSSSSSHSSSTQASKDESKRHDLECILEICARAGLADEAIEVRDRIRFGFGDEIANAPEIRRCLVEAFQRAGPERVEEALAVYNEELIYNEEGRARNSNSQLSPEFWIFLSLALRDANLLSENVAILKENLLTQKKSSTSILNSPNGTSSTTTTVQQKKYYPIAAANIVIDHCAGENVPGEAMDILDLINRDDNPLIADSVTYLALLKSTKKMGKNGPATAERIMEEMISKRGEEFVTTEHLNSLLAAYARGGEKFLEKSERTCERIVYMRGTSKPDEFEFVTMLYAYSVASEFRKAVRFYDRYANGFASDGERKPRIFNAAIRATILEPRLFRDVETIEEVNSLREMYADMTRRVGAAPSAQKKREEDNDDNRDGTQNQGEEGVSKSNNAYLRKQSENALKMLTRVAAEVNAKSAISSPSASTSPTPTLAPSGSKSDNEGEDVTIDASSLSPAETRSAVLTVLLELKNTQRRQTVNVINLTKDSSDAISRLASDVRIEFKTVTIRKTSSSSASSKFEKDIAFDRDDVESWLRKQQQQQ
jgi:pentatricopeptide repeat protein